jgi:hypothetical protein
MANVQTKLSGSILTITIDLSQKGDLSASRKSFLVASTNGAMQIPVANGSKLSLNLNAYTQNPDYVPTPEEVALKQAMKAARR